MTVESSQMVHFKAALVGIGGARPHVLLQRWAESRPEGAPKATRTQFAERLYWLCVPSRIATFDGLDVALHILAYEGESSLRDELWNAVDQDVDAVVLCVGVAADQATRVAAVASIEAWLRACGHVAPERCPLVIACDDDSGAPWGAPDTTSIINTSPRAAMEVLKQLFKHLITGRHDGDVVERGTWPLLRIGDPVVLSGAGVKTIGAIGPQDELTPPGRRVVYQHSLEQAFERGSLFDRAEADKAPVYGLAEPGGDVYMMITIDAAASQGLRSMSWPASIEVFLKELRATFQTWSVSMAPEDVSTNVALAGNDLAAIAKLYPSLVVAAEQDSMAQRQLDSLTRLLVEEIACVLDLSPDEATDRLLGALAS